MCVVLVFCGGASASAAELEAPGGLKGGDGSAPQRMSLTPAESVAPVGQLDDVLSYARAQRRMLEEAWGQPVVDWRKQARAAAEGDATRTGDETDGGTIRTLFRSTDLTGDGVHDPAFFEVAYAANFRIDKVTVKALHGRSGEVLWANDYGKPTDMFVLSPGDITGDGAGDLAVLTLRSTLTFADPVCQAFACVFNRSAAIRWEMAVLSGKNGKPAWSRSVDGSLTDNGGQVLGAPATNVLRSINAVNAAMDLRPAGDLDADGVRDLVLNAYDYRTQELRTGAFSTRNDVTLMTTRGQALKGSTGAVLHSRLAERTPGPGARLSGAGDDLLWTVNEELEVPNVCVASTACTGARRTKTSIERVGGWTVTFDHEDLQSTAPIMLSGDTILVGQRVAGTPGRLLAIRRSDGGEAWRTVTALTDPPTLLSGGRILLWEGDSVDEPGVLFRIRLRRIDAATGADLFDTRRALPIGDRTFDLIHAYLVGDVDGDGNADIAHAERHTAYENPPGTVTTRLEVESSSTGKTLFTGDRTRGALLFDGGGLQPGGADDLIEASTPFGDLDLQLRALAMPSGQELWQRRERLLTSFFGGSADPVHGGRLAIARTTTLPNPARFRSRVDVLRGTTGRSLFFHGNGEGLDPIEAEPASQPEPEPTPAPQPTPTPSPTPDPTVTPEPTATPEPEATATPEPTSERETTPAPTPTPAPAPATPARPVGTLPSPRVRIVSRRGRVVRVRVSCPCRGRITVRRGRTVVGRARFSGSGTVRVRLGRAVRGRLRVTAVSTSGGFER